MDCLKSANTEPYYRRQAWEVIKCFLVAMMSLDDNKHALYQLLAHPKYDNSLNVNVYVKFIVFLEQPNLETVVSLGNIILMGFLSDSFKSLQDSPVRGIQSTYYLTPVKCQCSYFNFLTLITVQCTICYICLN